MKSNFLSENKTVLNFYKFTLKLMTVFFGIMFLAFSLSGCTAKSSKAQQGQKMTAMAGVSSEIPKGIAGNELFKLLNSSSPQINLERENNTCNFKAEPGFLFYSNDSVQNVSSDNLQVRGIQDNAKFTLRADAKIQFLPASVILIQGTTRFEFSKIKGVYKVKIPGAILGIRGTTFDVCVNADKSTAIALLEGKIEIERGSEITVLKPGETAILGPNGSSFKLNPPSTELPEFLRKTTTEEIQKAIRKF